MPEEVSVVVGALVLEHRHETLEAHPRVDMLCGQHLKNPGDHSFRIMVEFPAIPWKEIENNTRRSKPEVCVVVRALLLED